MAVLFGENFLRKRALFATIFGGWFDLVGKALMYTKTLFVLREHAERGTREMPGYSACHCVPGAEG
jgi:hypothetical protein